MEKLSILFVLTSLTQCSYVPTLKIYYGLSEKQAAVLNKNKVNQYTAETVGSDGIQIFFEVLGGLRTESAEDLHKVYEAVTGIKKLVNISYDSVLVTLNDCCPGLEVARKASYEYIADATVEFKAALKLATNSNYWKTRDIIEIHRTTAQENIKKSVEEFYNAILTCANTRDHDAVSVIKNAQKQSSLSCVQTNNAIFNAIKLWAAAASDGYVHRNFICDMKDLEDKALFGNKQNVEYKFSTISTFYFYARLNKKGILPQLAANQYAVSESYRGYREGDDKFYFGIIRYLQYMDFGVDGDGQLDISRDDVDVIIEIAHYDAGDSSNVQSIRHLHRNSASKINETQKILFEINAIGTHGLWDLIHAAIAPGAKYSNVMNSIETARTEISGIAQNFTENYFIIIRNNQKFSKKQDAELYTLLKESIKNVLYSVNAYLDAIVVLANAAHRGKVSKDDFSAVLAYRDASSLGNDKLTQGISAASLLVAVSQTNNTEAEVIDATLLPPGM